jgi:spore germination cell wall hydrolase CwlJ-like protein
VRECTVKNDYAGSPDAIPLLALYLYAEAGAESVRAREAIAATIANQVEHLLSETAGTGPRSRRAALFIECLDRLGAAEATPPRTTDPIFASCWRIARRAVSGALQDPTGGAFRFHEIGARPPWAYGLNPCSWIGSYLFYTGDNPNPLSATLESSNEVQGSGESESPDCSLRQR